ncbi:MAG: CDP-diacylglycerol--serine O-phosphatidyltransferase [Endomicrobium sp.]|uniref:CDP-diacylglycerol--serine O-phosphatidyltransferase n=1 Tax=Candidatus Endomicrobiellum pyrsonymphae TaxID=1408203 RepID=UPI00358168C2|nr:CDP-diacylglycerol--serine O-phosphatidyltransferase [Endomicrobium sp.]
MSEKLKKGIYIIPSLFTCSNMSCGYLSVMSSIEGDFTKAAWLLILAIVCDMMDGRIARLTRTTSEFGIQLDSLSDLVSFGIAPSVMMYQLVLNSMGKVGMAIAVLFVLCSGLRLAKFNVQAKDNVTHASFIGLPTPASAGLLMSFVLSYELFVVEPGQSLTFKTIPLLMRNMPIFFKIMPVVMIILSWLMVSNIQYVSFKKMNLSKPKAFRLLVLIIILIFLVIAFPQNIIFILFSLYALSGIVFTGARYYRAYQIKISLKKGE